MRPWDKAIFASALVASVAAGFCNGTLTAQVADPRNTQPGSGNNPAPPSDSNKGGSGSGQTSTPPDNTKGAPGSGNTPAPPPDYSKGGPGSGNTPAPSPDYSKGAKGSGNTPGPSLPGGSSWPVGSAIDFSGRWDTLTNQGARYSMRLTQSGDGAITGSFEYLGAQKEYGGVISGNIVQAERRFNYTYRQHNAATGSGSFQLTKNGQAMQGSGVSAKGEKFSWSGSRM